MTGQVAEPKFDTIAKSGDIVAAIADSNRKIFGVQFHPEVDLTKFGKEIFSNFLNIAQVPRVFTEDFRDEECIAEIKEQVGENGKILVLVSGGVDSCVLAALCFKAIGKERVKCIHIDNGFMRKGESEEVVKVTFISFFCIFLYVFLPILTNFGNF